ncbi:MAG: hypothetical protein OXG33_04170 [Chloroflexi bacterium]|nr:hypothetical protein [Chloroflexota bacterium]
MAEPRVQSSASGCLGIAATIADVPCLITAAAETRHRSRIPPASRRRTTATDHGPQFPTVTQVADTRQFRTGRVRRLWCVGLIRHIRIPSHTRREDLHVLLDVGQPGSSSRRDATWNA